MKNVFSLKTLLIALAVVLGIYLLPGSTEEVNKLKVVNNSKDKVKKTSMQNNSNTELQVGFVHTVYFWLKNPDSTTDRNLFESSIQKFMSNSKFAKTKFIGIPAQTPREVVDNSFTYSLIVSFNSKADHELYQKEEAHKQFLEEAMHLWNKVLIYDSLGAGLEK